MPAESRRIKGPVMSLTALCRRQEERTVPLENKHGGSSLHRARLQGDFLPACGHSMRQLRYGILVMHCKWRLSFLDPYT